VGDGGAPVEIEATPLDGEPEPEPALLVLEAAAANVLIVEGATVVTPPLKGRLLLGTARARVLAAAASVGLGASEEPITLERMAAADEVLLRSAISGVRPAALTRRRPPRFETGARLRDVLRESAVVETR
jgi:branched-chain amino acid aminotransferase